MIIRLQLLIFLIISIFLISCGDDTSECSSNSDCSSSKVCHNDKCINPEVTPSLTFYNLTDGMFLNAYEYDEDPTEAGIQVSILIDTVDLEDGTEVNLMIDGDDSSKTTTTISSSKAIFRTFTLPNGSNSLVASSIDKYGREIYSDTIVITVQDYSIEITSPIQDLTINDDNNSEKYYIQKDVQVQVLGVNDGVSIKLSIYNNENQTLKSIHYTYLNSGGAIFTDVDFPEGEWKLVASFQNINGATISSQPIVINAPALPGDCSVSIIPTTGTIINQEFLTNDEAEGKSIILKVESNCPEGFVVTYTANPNSDDETIIATDILRQVEGKNISSTTFEFPENKDRNGENSTLYVKIENSENSSEGGQATAIYTVDTISPLFTEITFPENNYEFFPGNDKDMEEAGMQFIVSGSTDDAIGDLIASVDGEGEQVFNNAIRETHNFNTEILDGDKYIDVLVSGEHTITLKAKDQYGNEGTIDIPIRVYLDDINITFKSISSVQITDDIMSDGLNLNINHDSDEDIINLQTLIVANVEGLDIGRDIALYVDDTEWAVSQILENGDVQFNLNSEDLGFTNGTHQIYLRTLDDNGPQSAPLNVNVSTSIPTLFVANYDDGVYVNEESLTIDVITTNLSNGEQVFLTINNIEQTPAEVVDNHAIFENIDLNIGENNITFNATDFAGNSADPITLIINYDPYQPEITIDSPLNGVTLQRDDDNNDVIPGIQTDVIVTIDNELEGIEVDLFFDDNTIAEASTTLNNENKAIFNDITLNSGELTIKVIATDFAGNSNESSITIVVDDGCYALKFLAPTINNAYLNSTSFEGIVNLGPSGINNNIPDGIELSLSIGDNSYNTSSLSGGAIFSNVTLSEGDNILNITYQADQETTCYLTSNVNYDTVSPEISTLTIVDSMQNNHSFSSAESPVLGKLYDRGGVEGAQLRINLDINNIEDQQNISLVIDGDNENSQMETVTCGQSQCSVIFDITLDENAHTLEFVATDRNGNSSSPFILNPIIDLTTPTVAFEDDFPIRLNTSPGVDNYPTISGVQYDVVAELSNIQEGDIVQLYVNGSLAMERKDIDINTQIPTEATLSEGETTHIFENVTFPLSEEEGYEIKLVVFDSALNKTEDIKNNYKVLNELIISFLDSLYKTRNSKRDNNLSHYVSLYINRLETGTMFLDVASEIAPNTIINTNSYVMDGTGTSHEFALTNVSDIMNDGRYILTPRFEDQSGFDYSGDIGYLAIKRTSPSINSYQIVQDLDDNGVLNIAEDMDGNPSNGFQTAITIEFSDIYLDSDDFTNNPISFNIRKGSINGTIISSAQIPENGQVTVPSVTLSDGISQQFFIELTDNFDNSLPTPYLTTLTVDTAAPSITSVTTSTKTISSDIKFLVVDDGNLSTNNLQTELIVNGTDCSNVTVSTSPVGGFSGDQNFTAGIANFGTVTINDGTYNFIFVATDDSGNTTTVQYDNIIVDTLAPSLDLIVNGGPSFTDSDDVDGTTGGFQIEVEVQNMANIEEGQTVEIQSNLSGNYVTVATFIKGAENSKTLNLTLSQGTGSLRAKAKDLNNNEGISSEVPISISLSSCSFNFVKKGTTSLTNAETNYFNDSDLIAGEVELTIETTVACTGHNILTKKGGATILTNSLDSTTITISIPFTNGDDVALNFTIEGAGDGGSDVDSQTYPIVVDTDAPSFSRSTPSVENITFVNISNTTIDGTAIFGDSNSGSAGAQGNLTINVLGANGGTIELFSDIDGSLGVENVTSDDQNIIFTGITLSDNNTHTISAKVIDIAGNEDTQNIYTAIVDVTNPGDISNILHSAPSDSERRLSEVSFQWTQSNTGDDGADGLLAKYVIRYSTTSFTNTDFETITDFEEIVINNPDISTASYNYVLENLIFQNEYTVAVKGYDELENGSNVLLFSTSDELKLSTKDLGVVSLDNVSKMKAVGDINGDGYDDFVIADPLHGATDDGKIVIYYGTGDPSTFGSVTQEIVGQAGSYEALGTCVASGDFNGDGLTDLFVGIPYSDWYFCSQASGCYGGQLRVYYNQGSGNNLNTGDVTNITDNFLHTEANIQVHVWGWGEGLLGYSCGNAGNVDGDLNGTDEIIVSEYGALYNNGANQKGRAIVIKGRTSKPATIDIDSDGTNSIILEHKFGDSGLFGYSVAGVGDIDGADSVDVAVSDTLNKKIAIYHLSTSTSGTLTTTDSNVVVVEKPTQTGFGTEIIGNIDLNNDGNMDLVIGNDSAQDVIVFYGDSSRFNSDQTVDARLRTNPNQNNYGTYLDVGDFNGDDKKDIVVGALNKVNIYLHKDTEFSGVINPDITLTRSVDFSTSTSDGIFNPIAVQTNDDDNDSNVDKDDISDFVICNGTGDYRCFIKY